MYMLSLHMIHARIQKSPSGPGVLTFLVTNVFIGVAPITQLGTCVIKVVAFKRGHLMR